LCKQKPGLETGMDQGMAWLCLQEVMTCHQSICKTEWGWFL
jgi:hypothetical protein